MCSEATRCGSTQTRRRVDTKFILALTLLLMPFFTASCDKCNFNAAYFYQLQIRSADEPMTTCAYTTFSSRRTDSEACASQSTGQSHPLTTPICGLNKVLQMCSMRAPVERELTPPFLSFPASAWPSSPSTRTQGRIPYHACVRWLCVPWWLSVGMVPWAPTSRSFLSMFFRCCGGRSHMVIFNKHMDVVHCVDHAK